MSVSIADLRDSFEGVIPSIVATLDADGLPNISYLSQVYFVDEAHVALSNQFFSKTAANVRATGRATVMVVDGRTGAQHQLDLAFERSITEGPLFDRMAVQLTAISSQHGAADAMVLRSAELYRVEARRAVGPVPVVPPPTSPPRLEQAARVAADIAAGADADAALDAALRGLGETFGFANAMILAADADTGRLTTLAALGYPGGGAGSEVEPGEGVIGMAAASRLPVRLSDMSRGRRFAQAVRRGAELEHECTIPLPGLAEPQSQLATPMIARGRLAGVMFVESGERFAFTQADEDALMLVGAQLAAALRLAELEAREPRPAAPPQADPAEGSAFRVRYYAHDDSLFIEDAYVIKGVPGRLLFHCLRIFVDTGRREFTNREIRLDPALRLPDLKDNLETRLILLRRRLDERGCPVRLSRPARGRLRLELEGVPEIEVVPRA